MEQYQLTYDIDKKSVEDEKSHSIPQDMQIITGQETLIEQIAKFVEREESIPIAMIGFPFKSTNTEKKVIGHLPDGAERHALKHINSMLIKIRDVYPQGATFRIISDGCTFNDIVGIPDTTIEAYENALKVLASDLKDIQIVTSRDLKSSPISTMTDLRQVIESYPPTLQDFDQMVANSSSMQYELDVIKSRLALEFDHKHGQETLELIKEKEFISDPLLLVSKKIIVRSRQFGKFITSTFLTKPYLKFSVHFQQDVGKKFGMKLSEISNVTPWHGVLIQEGNSYRIVHKSDVPLTNVTQTGEMANGIYCPYYKYN